ncbi:hypothetical protein [Streptomyces sp. NPDC098926]|uniref:hypothetical protein n=1 Tax=Streptomyces sp. NPDC098926 TaxID=3366099 RepID=UPI00381B830C
MRPSMAGTTKAGTRWTLWCRCRRPSDAVARAADARAGALGLGLGQHLVLKMLAEAGPYPGPNPVKRDRSVTTAAGWLQVFGRSANRSTVPRPTDTPKTLAIRGRPGPRGRLWPGPNVVGKGP